MKTPKPVIYLIAIVILVSIAYTAWSFISQQPDKKKFAKYVAVTAIIEQKLPGRINRFGAKPTRYQVAFTTKDGEKRTASNLELGAEKNVGEQVTVYYNPENAGDEVVSRLP